MYGVPNSLKHYLVSMTESIIYIWNKTNKLENKCFIFNIKGKDAGSKDIKQESKAIKYKRFNIELRTISRNQQTNLKNKAITDKINVLHP